MKMVKHAHVVKLYEVLASRTKIFIVLELVTGGELFDKIVAEGRFKEENARFYFWQLMRAVKYCHDQGVAHRDLKPENLLLDEASNLKISDFGLSALYTGADGDTSRATLLHTTCGTPNYVAPEVLQDKGYDGAAADIWSCGVILYVLRAGFLPFDEMHMSTLFKKIQAAEYVYPSWFEPDLKDLIDHILVPDPAKRYNIDDVIAHPWMKASGGMGFGGKAGAAIAAAAMGGAKAADPAAGASKLSTAPSAKDVAEAVAEGVKEEGKEDDDALPALNAFEVVNLFGGLALNKLLASDKSELVALSTPQFITQKKPAEVVTAAVAAFDALGSRATVDEKRFRVSAEVLTKNGAVGAFVQLYKMTDTLHLVEIERGRGDILAYTEVYKGLRRGLDPLATKDSTTHMSGAAAGGGGR